MGKPIDNANSERIDRIKKILRCEEDKDLAERCEVQKPRISSWRRTGFHQSTTTLIDALIEQYEKDCQNE